MGEKKKSEGIINSYTVTHKHKALSAQGSSDFILEQINKENPKKTLFV